MIAEVYDLEILSNCFTYTGYTLQTGEFHQFVIHDSRNDVEELYNHLMRDKQLLQIGFNNESFDYPILHYFIQNYKRFLKMTGEEIAIELYKYVQHKIIGNQDEQNRVRIWDNKKFIKQLDLYLIWHYNNDARRTSLKDLEFAMQMNKIEEMPIKHWQYVMSEMIPKILDYNMNDVVATVKFLFTTLGETDYKLYKGRNKIQLRDVISEKFGINATNLGDVKIGEQLALKLYCDETGQDPNYVKNLRTIHNEIALKDCIPPWCNLKTKEFLKFKNVLENTILDTTGKIQFSKSVIFHGIQFDFGLGGSHGCIKSGVYNSDKDWAIYDLDVGSLYPILGKILGLYPKHLGPAFLKLTNQFIEKRLAEKAKPKDQRDNGLIEAYKLILNGLYGKSGEATSFMFDLLYTYRTTIAGQILIAMWAERMVEVVPELIFIQINTDGITIKVPRSKLNLIQKVCDDLSKELGISIEDAYYDRMVIRDVNNYAARYEDTDDIKYKGVFDVCPEYHKDHSMLVVPKALEAYFFNNIPIREFVENHDNIYDFCLRLKINSASRALYNYINEDNELQTLELDRTTRYYISNGGGSLTVFYNRSSKQNRINVGWNSRILNNIDDHTPDINYEFYIQGTKKIVREIEDHQGTLF